MESKQKIVHANTFKKLFLLLKRKVTRMKIYTKERKRDRNPFIDWDRDAIFDWSKGNSFRIYKSITFGHLFH